MKHTKINESAMKDIAISVINMAVADYATALVYVRNHPEHKPAQAILADCESFFKNEFAVYAAIVDPELTGEYVMRLVKAAPERHMKFKPFTPSKKAA